MSGDSHNNDDADFLDEDFVVEDLANGNEDLEDLFAEPAPGAPQPASDDAAADGAASEDPDEADVLFTDHTEGLQASEQFEMKEQFDEDGDAQWDGREVDLAKEVEGDAPLEPLAEQDAASEEAADPRLAEAKDSFTEELDSMLSEEDFAIDSEHELELVDHTLPSDAAEIDDGISEFEQSGPFVLDDGDGLWAEENAEAAGEAETAEAAAGEGLFDGGQFAASQFDAGALGDDASEAQEQTLDADSPEHDAVEEGVEEMPLLEAASADDDGGTEDWQPLPSTSMDQLSEVDGVERTDEYEDEAEFDEDADVVYGEFEGEATVPGMAQPELDEVDGHDIYDEQDEQEAAVIGGPGSRRSGVWTALVSLAAALLLIGGAATVVLRPQWFGLRMEPERVERVEVKRPRIEVAVDEPVLPKQPEVPQVGMGEDGPNGPDTTPPETTNPEAGVDGAANEGGAPTTGPDSVAVGTQPEKPAENVTENPTNEQPSDPPGEGAGNGEAVAVSKPEPADDTNPVVPLTPGDGGDAAWPVEPSAQQPVAVAGGETKLDRFGDGLMVGDRASTPRNVGNAVDGVLPGSRAFAQLHNGNYFIGSVKQVAADTITLRVASGEVTLPTEELAQLTKLGSADYEELQKATKGFVRLTNNNRLVGGILSRIADDHVVLEFRSNRVMLPKSVIGEIVSGDAEVTDVRIDTTREEDNWLRKLAERELGTGRGAETTPRTPASNGTRRGGPPR